MISTSHAAYVLNRTKEVRVQMVSVAKFSVAISAQRYT